MANEQLKEAILSQNPTEQQQAAIFADSLEYLLRAAPGSGKTWTSCRRFIWRGANWDYPVGGLALLSFTNVAIREFKQATVAVGRGDLLSDPNYVGTFDSFVERYIISPFGHLITGNTKRPRLFTGPRPGYWNNKKLSVWINATGGRKQPIPAWEILPYPDGKKLRSRTSRTRGNLDLPSESIAAVRALLDLGYYTHSHRVFWACKVLFDRPHLARVIARRFPEIIVDEAQDCNAWLLVLLNYLRDKGAKITLIGDPDQCIYEFSMADATSLPNLKAKWSIPEMLLSQSFRCRNPIADAARNISGNIAFTGCGKTALDTHGPYIIREETEGSAGSVTAFMQMLEAADIAPASSVVICRAHGQLESIRGKANYSALKGKTRDMATATFLRDVRRDYRGAFQTVYRIVRELTGEDDLWDSIDEDPEGRVCLEVSLAIWQFVKDQQRLPPISQIGKDWIAQVRDGLKELIKQLGVTAKVNLGQNIKKTGLKDDQLPLFAAIEGVPQIRQDTIHQVKGESIDAVMVVGSAKFWNSVVKAVQNGAESEDRRLAYVAMTRARHLPLISLPGSHFDVNAEAWKKWGFKVAG